MASGRMDAPACAQAHYVAS